MDDSWQQITVRSSGADEERVAELLSELGALAVTTEGDDCEIWLEAGLPEAPRWTDVSVTGLYGSDANGEHLLAEVSARLDTPHAVLSRLADRDWERECLDRFKSFKAGRGLWVVPTWCEPVAEAEHMLRLDPGLAFGTGSHPTTAMCLERLSHMDLKGKRVIDVGCGSGILAIAALVMGATSAVGTDVDPRALTAAHDNAVANDVADRLEIHASDSVPADLTGDIVVANILAGTLISLASEIMQFVRPRGHLLLSGILADQADQVASAYCAVGDFQYTQDGDWMLLTHEPAND